MRKVMLLLAAIGLCGGMGTIFVSSFTAPFASEEALSPTVVTVCTQPVMIQLPCPVPGTGLTAEMLVVYDGPFMEDGSEDEVSGVTALLIRNNGQTMIESGEVILESGEAKLEFAFSYLPANEKVLVAEKNRQKVRPENFTGCHGHTELMECENSDSVSVVEMDPITLEITNESTETVWNLRILFKSYDSPADIYIGGNTRSATIEQLLPGETFQLSPYHYVQGYSKIVAIITG